MQGNIAVIDIGMTNKKINIFNRALECIDSQDSTFAPLMVRGIETHDLKKIEEWIVEHLGRLAKKHGNFGAIVVATHGATMVCIDEQDEACAPCVYYTHEPGQAFHDRFYACAGDPLQLQKTTGTPAFSALINPAKGLLFLKEAFPAEFARTKTILNYPQYWGFRMTGIIGAESTYVGCHTYLWDWEQSRYSSVARNLGVEEFLPKDIRHSWDVLGTVTPAFARRCGLDASTIVTMGIHDSNASLLPLLAVNPKGNFVLNSTGTWCVLMHPQDEYGFKQDELGKVVFFNRSAYNKPVKSAIFLGGMERDSWLKLFDADSSAQSTQYDSIVRQRSEFLLPEIIKGSGQFPHSCARLIEHGTSYSYSDLSTIGLPSHLLHYRSRIADVIDISLAMQTLVALDRAGYKNGELFVIIGRFIENTTYCALLAQYLGAAFVKRNEFVFLTSMGAAMTGLAALEHCTPDAFAHLDIMKKIYDSNFVQKESTVDRDAIEEYKLAWLKHCHA